MGRAIRVRASESGAIVVPPIKTFNFQSISDAV
jgi:hypothetical protein